MPKELLGTPRKASVTSELHRGPGVVDILEAIFTNADDTPIWIGLPWLFGSIAQADDEIRATSWPVRRDGKMGRYWRPRVHRAPE